MNTRPYVLVGGSRNVTLVQSQLKGTPVLHFTPKIPNALPAAPTIPYPAFTERCHGLTFYFNGQPQTLQAGQTLDGIPVLHTGHQNTPTLTDQIHPHILKGIAFRLGVNVQAHQPYFRAIHAEENPLVTLLPLEHTMNLDDPLYGPYPIKLAALRHRVHLTTKPVVLLEPGDVIVEPGFTPTHDGNDQFWSIQRMAYESSQVPFYGYHRSFVVQDLHSGQRKTLTLKAADSSRPLVGTKHHTALVIHQEALDRSRLN